MAIKIGKDGSITRDGKTYKNKAAYKNRDKSKEGPKKGSFFEKFIEGSKSKKARAAKASAAQGKKDQAATSKMYAAESMFTSAKNRDDNKVKPGKARSFKDAFDAANKADKDKFLHKGKSYFTTKGAADNRDKMKTKTGEAGSMSRAKPTGPNKPKRTVKGLLKKIFKKKK
jgi:hypothetical protein